MSIRIDQGDTGTPGESREDLAAGDFTATWTGTPGSTYQWYMAVSEGCTAVLSDDTLITCAVTGIAAGDTVCLFLDVDGVEQSYTTEYGGRSSSQGGAAVLNALGIAQPARGERGQFGGWDVQLSRMLARIVAHALVVPTANEKTSLGQLDGGAQGSVFYAASTGRAARLAPGTSGQVLTTGGAGANPTWETSVSGVTDHGLLDGLGDDDHSQYLLADGSRTLSGDLAVTGTVDGRDVDADGTKLDGIEASADVTDAANVESAGAVMDSDFSGDEGILRKTGAGTYTLHKTNLTASTAPGVNDDSSAGYSVGSLWIDTVGGDVYTCVDASVGAAVWSSGGGGSGDVVGPGSSTDNVLARFDGATGKLLQDGATVEDSSGNVTVNGNLLYGAGYDLGSSSQGVGRAFFSRSEMHKIIKKTTSFTLSTITSFSVLFEISAPATATLGNVTVAYDGMISNIINSSSSTAALAVSGGVRTLDAAVPTSLAAGESCTVQYYHADLTWYLVSKG